MGTLVIVAGPPCAGKTVYCRSNRKPCDIIIDYDAIVNAFTDDAADVPSREAAHFPALEAVDAAIEEADVNMRVRVAYVIVGTRLRLETLQHRYQTAEVVLLDPGRQECERRAHARALVSLPFATAVQGTLDGIARWYGPTEPKLEKLRKSLERSAID